MEDGKISEPLQQSKNELLKMFSPNHETSLTALSDLDQGSECTSAVTGSKH